MTPKNSSKCRVVVVLSKDAFRYGRNTQFWLLNLRYLLNNLVLSKLNSLAFARHVNINFYIDHAKIRNFSKMARFEQLINDQLQVDTK